MQDGGNVRGVGDRIEERERVADVLEGALGLILRELGLREDPQEFAALGPRRAVSERDVDLGAHRAPVRPLGGGFGSDAVEVDPLGSAERLIADEVLDPPPQASGDDLQRPKRRAHEARLDLANEALGKLLARKLRLTHTQLAASGAHTLAERYRLLRGLERTCHRRYDTPQCLLSRARTSSPLILDRTDRTVRLTLRIRRP